MAARVLTAIVGIPLLLFVALSPSELPLLFFIVFAGLLMFYEQAKVEHKFRHALWLIVPAAFVCASVPILHEAGRLREPPAVPIFIELLLLALTLKLGFFGRQIFWLAAPILSLSFLHTDSVPWLLFLFVCLWSGDTLAYFVGKAIGKHPLAPKISPKKTWEGAIANLIASIAAGITLGLNIQGITPASGALLGGVIGVAGQLGDLTQSAWKRSHGLKDSGSLLPGHGGMLDRFDSLLFAAPALLAALLLSSAYG